MGSGGRGTTAWQGLVGKAKSSSQTFSSQFDTFRFTCASLLVFVIYTLKVYKRLFLPGKSKGLIAAAMHA